jgi:hypothetical protein
VFRGLRVRMGAHTGNDCSISRHPVTGGACCHSTTAPLTACRLLPWAGVLTHCSVWLAAWGPCSARRHEMACIVCHRPPHRSLDLHVCTYHRATRPCFSSCVQGSWSTRGPPGRSQRRSAMPGTGARSWSVRPPASASTPGACRIWHAVCLRLTPLLPSRSVPAAGVVNPRGVHRCALNADVHVGCRCWLAAQEVPLHPGSRPESPKRGSPPLASGTAPCYLRARRTPGLCSDQSALAAFTASGNHLVSQITLFHLVGSQICTYTDSDTRQNKGPHEY